MIKKIILLFIAISLFLLSFVSVFTKHFDAKEDKMRKAMVAGGFYPADAGELKDLVDQFLSEAKTPQISENIIGLISPHAGYVYSGQVAAHGYALLKNQNIERVVVISPSHVDAFNGAAVYDGDAYETPLGTVLVDRIFAEKLVKMDPLIKSSSKGHETLYRGRGEHALEVQLPFLQRVIKDFKIVPIIMGDQDYETCRSLGKALADLIDDSKTVMVTSSDLSHFHSYDEAVKLDLKLLNAIQEWDYFNLSRNLKSRTWEACGGGPIVATMIAAEGMGATEAKLLKYANSGDVPYGDKSGVVGYASIVFYKEDQSKSDNEKEFSLTKDEQEELMRIAKNAVELKVRDGKIFLVGEQKFTSLLKDRGAFVTLKIDGHLRGCIGYTSPVQPLFETVKDVAISAATRDPRFRPVDKKELDSLTYEISVLSPMKKVIDINEITVGKHGLLIKKGFQEGLLLPQVAPEQGWNRLAFLEHTCQKAGLPPGAWKDEDTDIFAFTAFIFGEE